MKLGLCLHRYFAFGGREQNCLRIAEEALARGHAVRIYTWHWDGAIPAGVELVLLPRRGASNHARARRFADAVLSHRAAHPCDLLLGFHPMPGLDACYVADAGIAPRLRGVRGALLAHLPRYRTLLALEHAVFAPDSRTRVLALAPAQLEALRACYGTPAQRCELLPPGIRRDRAAGPDQPRQRAATRAALGLAATDMALLALGSGFRTKGLDRSLRALAALPAGLRPQVQLLVAGVGEPGSFVRLARRLGVGAQLQVLGGRDDVPALLAAADLLLHPARSEATGMVLLEAASAGLPVLASGACGYAPHVAEHGFGRVLREPFVQAEYNDALRQMLQASETERAAWRERGLAFARAAAIHDRAPRVLDLLEAMLPP